MRYVSLDIETTGLNPSLNQILEIAAYIDDTDPDVFTKTPVKSLPQFHVYLRHARLIWDIEAMRINWSLLQKYLFDKSLVMEEPAMVATKFRKWLTDNGFNDGEKVSFAGKNFAGFDKQFLENLIGWKETVPVHYRSFDPGEYYFDPKKDKVKPSLYECAKRIGIEWSSIVQHSATDDAQLVISLLRNHWRKYTQCTLQS